MGNETSEMVERLLREVSDLQAEINEQKLQIARLQIFKQRYSNLIRHLKQIIEDEKEFYPVGDE